MILSFSFCLIYAPGIFLIQRKLIIANVNAAKAINNVTIKIHIIPFNCFSFEISFKSCSSFKIITYIN